MGRGDGFVRGRGGGANVQEVGQGKDSGSVEGLGGVAAASAPMKSFVKVGDDAVEDDSIGDIQIKIKEMQAKLRAKKIEVENDPEVLRDRLGKVQKELADEKLKSEIKQQMKIQNTSLIEKNRVLIAEVEEFRAVATEDVELDGEESQRIRAELDDALEREERLVREVSRLTEAGEGCERCVELGQLLEKSREAEVRLNEENEEYIGQVEECLNDKEQMGGRIAAFKVEIAALKAGVGEDKFEALKGEYEALKRRLGSADYKFLSAESVEEIVDKMKAPTKEMFDAFHLAEFEESEKLKFLLGVSHDLVPAARHILYKHLLNFDTAMQRDCVGKFLTKLCASDKEAKMMVKSVKSVKSVNENTPVKGLSGVSELDNGSLVADPSLQGMKVDMYMTKLNSGCRVINFRNLILVALTRSRHVFVKHKPLCDANGLPMESVCPIQSCRAKFEIGVTDIGPMTIVGPENHLRLGMEAWVCVSHVRDSIDLGDDDDFCDKAALTHDAEVLENQAGLGRGGCQGGCRGRVQRRRGQYLDQERRISQRSNPLARRISLGLLT